ncbi:hypothetical protein TWF694_005301 [Orbilia ellipsospora]|uniref:Uncharacterized protein n=1 Tax=Orbilia ellipsospora TaxID=2528407 RepID=A0AAV9WUA2_9PEZI
MTDPFVFLLLVFLGNVYDSTTKFVMFSLDFYPTYDQALASKYIKHPTMLVPTLSQTEPRNQDTSTSASPSAATSMTTTAQTLNITLKSASNRLSNCPFFHLEL